MHACFVLCCAVLCCGVLCCGMLCCGSVSPLIGLLSLLFVNRLARCCLACLTRDSILHPTHKSTLFHSIVKLPDDHRSAFVCIVTVATISCTHKFVGPSTYTVRINRSVIGKGANRTCIFKRLSLCCCQYLDINSAPQRSPFCYPNKVYKVTVCTY